MKSIFRSAMVAIFLIASAMPLFAQNPNVAIQMKAKTTAGEYCVAGTLKNLRTVNIDVSYIELWVYDLKTCKRVCITRKVINLKIKPCDNLNFELCCKNSAASSTAVIYYVRVHHSAGTNEQWLIEG
ncbi:MAG TPA: hypothetical protein VE863_07425 [Pyrinomonadaceae bacterium]|jgi:hypothetical protein|nr:hypothetical protein [Pyrinomonadaceae bacterium]